MQSVKKPPTDAAPAQTNAIVSKGDDYDDDENDDDDDVESSNENTNRNGPKQTIQTTKQRRKRELPRKDIKLGKTTLEAYELKRLPVVLRSKFSFYLEQPNAVSEAQKDSQRRLKELFRKELMERKTRLDRVQESGATSAFDLASSKSSKSLKQTIEKAEQFVKYEKERHERLIGQLKAAEAANRSRILKLRYVNMKKDELDNLIESQSTALDAVRLEAFLPTVKEANKLASDLNKHAGHLNQIERRRLEALIDDPKNAFIQRKLD